MPLQVVGQRAEKDVTSDSIIGLVVDGPYFELHGLETAVSPQIRKEDVSKAFIFPGDAKTWLAFAKKSEDHLIINNMVDMKAILKMKSHYVLLSAASYTHVWSALSISDLGRD